MTSSETVERNTFVVGGIDVNHQWSPGGLAAPFLIYNRETEEFVPGLYADKKTATTVAIGLEVLAHGPVSDEKPSEWAMTRPFPSAYLGGAGSVEQPAPPTRQHDPFGAAALQWALDDRPRHKQPVDGIGSMLHVSINYMPPLYMQRVLVERPNYVRAADAERRTVLMDVACAHAVLTSIPSLSVATAVSRAYDWEVQWLLFDPIGCKLRDMPEFCSFEKAWNEQSVAGVLRVQDEVIAAKLDEHRENTLREVVDLLVTKASKVAKSFGDANARTLAYRNAAGLVDRLRYREETEDED